MITIIAAIGKNREIGYNNRLLWNIPEDMAHFKKYTTGKVVIMGGNTFSSIGRALPNRKCIVISKQKCSSVICAKDIDSALSIGDNYSELVIIGGASIYSQTMCRADKLIITHIDAEFVADTFFPIIDLAIWQINSVVESSNAQYNYRFVEYIRDENSGIPN